MVKVTVADAIGVLSELPPDAVLVLQSGKFEFFPIDSLEIKTAYRDSLGYLFKSVEFKEDFQAVEVVKINRQKR